MNYYDVIVDDQAPVKITAAASVTAYDVPVTLTGCATRGDVHQRTEASIGYCEFLGFKVGELVVRTQATRKIEVIRRFDHLRSGDEAADESAQCARAVGPATVGYSGLRACRRAGTPERAHHAFRASRLSGA